MVLRCNRFQIFAEFEIRESVWFRNDFGIRPIEIVGGVGPEAPTYAGLGGKSLTRGINLKYLGVWELGAEVGKSVGGELDSKRGKLYCQKAIVF
jgi:hypothetical protein